MSEYISKEDLDQWLSHHDINPKDIERIEFDAGTYQVGAMRVFSYYVEPGTQRRIATPGGEVLMEEKIVPLKSLPDKWHNGQRSVWE